MPYSRGKLFHDSMIGGQVDAIGFLDFGSWTSIFGPALWPFLINSNYDTKMFSNRRFHMQYPNQMTIEVLASSNMLLCCCKTAAVSNQGFALLLDSNSEARRTDFCE